MKWMDLLWFIHVDQAIRNEGVEIIMSSSVGAAWRNSGGTGELLAQGFYVPK